MDGQMAGWVYGQMMGEWIGLCPICILCNTVLLRRFLRLRGQGAWALQPSTREPHCYCFIYLHYLYGLFIYLVMWFIEVVQLKASLITFRSHCFLII